MLRCQRIDLRVNLTSYDRVGADQNLDWHQAVATTLDWWRDAGADVVVGDTAFNWLDAPADDPVMLFDGSAAAAPAALPDRSPSDRLPDDLAAFAAWRIGADAPEAQWRGPALCGSGAANADLMVLVDCPERGDRDGLLEGEVGQLFDRMLAAIGRSRSDILLASVCTRRPTTGRVPREIEARLATIAQHHVALAAPKRLLVMGDAATRAMLGTNAAESRGRLHDFNHKAGSTIHVVASHHPRMLLDRPVLKSEAWKDLLMLIEEPAS